MRESDLKQASIHKYYKLAAFMVLIALIIFAWTAPPVSAADTLTVKVSKGEQTATVASYSEDELEALGTVQQYYSSVDANGAPVVVVAQGILIADLLADLGIDVADAETLRFSSSDGGNRSYNVSTYVSTTRYYYPQIVKGYDDSADETPAFLPGADQEKVTVGTMLALISYEGRYEANPDASAMSSANGLRFCYGQTAITEAVSLNFSKHINKLTIILKNSSDYQLPAQENTGEGEDNQSSAIPSTGIPEALDNQGFMADTLTITVGYWGGKYYTKKVFTLEELEAMANVQQVYSYIDNMPAPCLDSVVGVRLKDILEAAGIDVNSVQSFHFYCADVSRTWYLSIGKDYLLDTIRYYYPNQSLYWDYEESKAIDGATMGAVRVETVLALKDKWRRFATEADFDGLTDTTRFRLVFGQTDVATPTGSKSAKWVHTIVVTLGGSPPKGVALDADVLDLKVGSEYQLTATVEKTDETSDTRVTWSSSNEDIVSVDKSGKITVKGEGQATVTATTVTGGFTATAVVNGSDSAEENTAAAGGGNTNDSNTSEKVTESAADDMPTEQSATGGVYRISANDNDMANKDAAVQKWRNSDMADDAVALPDIDMDSPLMKATLITVIALFFGGIIGRIIIYRLEV